MTTFTLTNNFIASNNDADSKNPGSDFAMFGECMCRCIE